MTWHLKLFGPFELSGPEGPAALASPKLSALLAYLALARKPVPREEAASLLWGSHFEEQARQSIRQALVRLRKAVDSEVLLTNDGTLEINAALVDCDVHIFERLLNSTAIDDLRSAVEALSGEFLAGINIHEEAFEQWLSGERRRLGALACDALARLAADELGVGHAAEALRHAEACIARDDLREDAHRLAMRALAALGRRSEAVRHYQELEARLKKELGATPEPSTKEVVETLRTNATASGTHDPPAAYPSSETVSQAGKKPSIAVLSFANLSNDPEQDFMAEGISEDLITELSKFRSLFVISRNSSFSYKGSAVGPKDISAKLDVRYLVDGSVRRAGNRLRITAKLVDAAEELTIWADHYDRQLEDIFTIQDEVVRAIIAAIEPQLLTNERNRALRKPPENLDAWEAHQRALWQMYRYRREDRDLTLALFRRAIALDPRFASAHGGLALALYVYVLLGTSPDREADIEESVAEANIAIDLDEFDAFGYAALCRCYIVKGRPGDAVIAADKGIRLNPSFAMAHFGRGHALWHQGYPQDAIRSIDEAMRLSPLDPAIWAYMASRAIALLLTGEREQAVDWSRRAQQQNNAAIFAHVGEIGGLGLLDRQEEAKDAIRRARITMPDVSVSFLDRTLPITDPANRKIFLKGLRLSGLPD